MNGPARFFTSLSAKWVDEKQRELTGPLGFYSAYLGKLLIVPTGFVTDLGSVPRLPFVYLLFGSVADPAAVVHDYLYTNNVEGVTRKQADEVFAEAMGVLQADEMTREKGVSRALSKLTNAPRRGLMWLGVRLFGGSHWGTGSPLLNDGAGTAD